MYISYMLFTWFSTFYTCYMLKWIDLLLGPSSGWLQHKWHDSAVFSWTGPRPTGTWMMGKRGDDRLKYMYARESSNSKLLSWLCSFCFKPCLGMLPGTKKNIRPGTWSIKFNNPNVTSLAMYITCTRTRKTWCIIGINANVVNKQMEHTTCTNPYLW